MSTILFLLAEGLSLRLTCWPPKITLSLHISFLLKWCRALQLALGLISILHSLTLGNFFPTFWTSLFHWSLLCFLFLCFFVLHKGTLDFLLCRDYVWMPLCQQVFAKCYINHFYSPFFFKTLVFLNLEALYATWFNVALLFRTSASHKEIHKDGNMMAKEKQDNLCWWLFWDLDI